VHALQPLESTFTRASVKDRTLASGNVKNYWLVAQFYLSMLAVAGIDACFAVIYEIPLGRFLPTAILLVVLTLTGAFFIFRPIHQYILHPGDDAVPVRRITNLGHTCTAYMAAIISILAATKFILLPNILDFDIGSLLTPGERLWLPILHTLYYTALIYFVMVNYEATLRIHIFRRFGRLMPAATGSLLYKMLAAFGVTTLLPISLIVLHVFERDMILERHVLIQDIAASALGLCVTMIFVTRSLLGPIRSLETAMSSVRRNDLSVTVPVMSNDETGRLASGFNRMVKGLRERALIRATFGRYIPERVASAILSSGGDLKPRSAVATILYADIEGFTAIAEQMSPETVVEMLNEYFSAAVDLIEQNNGVVTQFQGDAILATFNLPVEDQHHAESAIRSGLSIQRLCSEKRFAGMGLRTRIGIATGTVTAGNVGSDSRVSYTVHGDAVNLAARLEQLNKRFDSYLLMDEATVNLLTLPMPIEFVDNVQIRGKEKFVRVYRYDGEAASKSPQYAFEAGPANTP
jgi:class 3 adenylate cyclase